MSSAKPLKPTSMTPILTSCPLSPAACQAGTPCAATPSLTIMPCAGWGGMIVRMLVTPSRWDAAGNRETGT